MVWTSGSSLDGKRRQPDERQWLGLTSGGGGAGRDGRRGHFFCFSKSFSKGGGPGGPPLEIDFQGRAEYPLQQIVFLAARDSGGHCICPYKYNFTRPYKAFM